MKKLLSTQEGMKNDQWGGVKLIFVKQMFITRKRTITHHFLAKQQPNVHRILGKKISSISCLTFVFKISSRILLTTV